MRGEANRPARNCPQGFAMDKPSNTVYFQASPNPHGHTTFWKLLCRITLFQEDLCVARFRSDQETLPESPENHSSEPTEYLVRKTKHSCASSPSRPGRLQLPLNHGLNRNTLVPRASGIGHRTSNLEPRTLPAALSSLSRQGKPTPCHPAQRRHKTRNHTALIGGRR